MCGSFFVRYNDYDLAAIIRDKSHPALNPDCRETGTPDIQHNYLYNEMEAAAVYGFDVYWNAPRGARQAMAGYVLARKTLEAMQVWEIRHPE